MKFKTSKQAICSLEQKGWVVCSKTLGQFRMEHSLLKNHYKVIRRIGNAWEAVSFSKISTKALAVA